jgi:hypothetical protein
MLEERIDERFDVLRDDGLDRGEPVDVIGSETDELLSPLHVDIRDPDVLQNGLLGDRGRAYRHFKVVQGGSPSPPCVSGAYLVMKSSISFVTATGSSTVEE